MKTDHWWKGVDRVKRKFLNEKLSLVCNESQMDQSDLEPETLVSTLCV